MLGAQDTGSRLGEVGRLRRQTLNGLLGVKTPALPTLWFASFSKSKAARSLGGAPGDVLCCLADTPQMAPAPGLSPVTFLPEGDPQVWAASACALLLFILSLQRKCEAAKSIPSEMLSNQRGFPETWSECARPHALLPGQGASPAAPLSVGLPGSREVSCFGNTAFYGPQPGLCDSVALLITVMFSGLDG